MPRRPLSRPPGNDWLNPPTRRCAFSAELDTSAYDTGVKVSDRHMDALPLTRHDWHSDWNYTLRPEAYDQAASAPDPPAGPAPTWPGSVTRR